LRDDNMQIDKGVFNEARIKERCSGIWRCRARDRLSLCVQVLLNQFTQ